MTRKTRDDHFMFCSVKHGPSLDNRVKRRVIRRDQYKQNANVRVARVGSVHKLDPRRGRFAEKAVFKHGRVRCSQVAGRWHVHSDFHAFRGFGFLFETGKLGKVRARLAQCCGRVGCRIKFRVQISEFFGPRGKMRRAVGILVSGLG